jgi:hypothetical protein
MDTHTYERSACAVEDDIPNVHQMKILPFLLIPLLAACTTWGYKTRTGASDFPPTDHRMIQVLFEPPDPATYTQVGFASVLGGASFITPDTDMLRKLQKSAADLGADAVILRREDRTAGYGQAFAAYQYNQNSGIAIRWKDPARNLPPLN